MKTPIAATTAASVALMRVFFVFDFLSELSSIIHLVFSDTYCDLSLDKSNWSVELLSPLSCHILVLGAFALSAL